MSVLVVGSVALDSVKTPVSEGKYILGGSAVHFSNAASKMAPSIHLVGVVGEDFKEDHIGFLRSKGVDLKGLVRKKGKTFHWEGYYEKDMNQAHTVKTELNLFENFDPVLPDEYKNDKFVFLANIDPVLQLRVLDQVKDPGLVVCDTMNFWIESKADDLKKVFARVNVVLLNDAEIRMLTGEDNLLGASLSILDMGPAFVIVKKGEHGFLIVSRQGLFAGPAMILENVQDPTGAGDSFAGGLVSYLASKGKADLNTMKKAALYATMVASFNVQGLGMDGLNLVSMKDIRKRFKEYRALTAIRGF